MVEEEFVVNLSGGGPWGFRLQGGKDFGRALAIQSITAGSKADGKGICPGDNLVEINGENTEKMTHLEAQNIIKRSQNLKLNIKRKPGNLAMAAATKSPIVTTETTHSAKVDYKYNTKPKPFGTTSAKSSQPKPVTTTKKPPSPTVKSPEEKKEDNLEDSEVLKMLRTADISDESTGLRRMSGGRKISVDSQGDDLPPPPPEAYGEDDEDIGPQSRSFRLLEQSISSGEEAPSVLSRPPANPVPPTARFKGPKPYSPPSHSKPPQTITVQSGVPTAPAYRQPSKPSSWTPPSQSTPSPPQSNPPPPQSVPLPKTTHTVNKKTTTPTCDSCRQLIQGPFVSALGRNWHPDHFKCDGCHRSLQNVGFVEESNQLFCEECYNDNFAPKCASCHQAIVGVSVKALGKVYHQEHFTCTHCGKQLAGEGFHVENGSPYCGKDYKDLFCVKCFSCKQIIRAGDRWMEAVNEKWHVDCFRCMTCGIVLEGTGFYTAGNRVTCPDHS